MCHTTHLALEEIPEDDDLGGYVLRAVSTHKETDIQGVSYIVVTPVVVRSVI